MAPQHIHHKIMRIVMSDPSVSYLINAFAFSISSTHIEVESTILRDDEAGVT